MSPDSRSTSNIRANQYISLASLLVLMVGGMVLIGWTFDIAVLKSILPIWVSMKANTAICFILSGVALWLITPPLSSPNISNIVARLSSVLVGMIGLLTLGGYIFGWNLGIDQWLFVEPTGAVGTSHPGCMAPETALDFVMLSVALWLLGISHKTRWMIVVSMSIGLLLAASALAAILTYFTPSLGSYGWFGLTIMAMNTALLFVLLGMAIVAACWNSNLVSWSLSRNNTVAFACGILILMLVGLNTNRSQYLMGELNRQIAFSETVLSDIETLMIGVISAQSHIRGYVITGDEVFKTGYLQTKADSLDKLDALRKLVVGHPHQEQQFAEIEAHVDAGLQWFQQVIDAREAGMSDAARHKRALHGEELLHNLRNTFYKVKSEHQQKVQQMRQRADAVSRLSYLILLGGTMTSLLIFLVVIFWLDLAVSAQKLADKMNYRMAQFYNALSHCNHAIVHSSDEQELFSQLCHDTVQFGGMKMAWIGLLDETSQLVRPVASFGAGIDYLKGIEISVDPNGPKGRGPTGTSIRENKPIWCQDYQRDPATAAWHERGARFGWGASAALPLRLNGEVIGALTVYEGEVNAFDAATQDLLVEMAMDISFALDNFSREAERKLIEIKLAEIAFNSKLLSDALDNLSSTFVFMKDLNGKYLYANHATLDLFKCTAEQLIGQDDAKFFPPDAVVRIKSIDQRVLEHGESTLEETEVSPNSPEWRVYLETKTPLYDSAGKIIGLCGISTDITERKLAEEKIKLLNEGLEATVKERTALLESSNKALAQFAYVASHDLQEPLRMVVGFVQLLEKRLADKLDTDTREFMGFAVDGALRMQTMIQDILAYSRVSTKGRPLVAVDSATALDEASSLLATQITETGAEIKAQSLPMVMADRMQLVQLFENLISNAIKFCKGHAPRVQVAAVHEAGWWRFSVTDNGIGIAPEYRGQLFVIFKRLHSRREYPGTGIGLAICKSIIERHGGEIGIDSAPDGGSVFWFTLPEEKCK